MDLLTCKDDIVGILNKMIEYNHNLEIEHNNEINRKNENMKADKDMVKKLMKDIKDLEHQLCK